MSKPDFTAERPTEAVRGKESQKTQGYLAPAILDCISEPSGRAKLVARQFCED